MCGQQKPSLVSGFRWWYLVPEKAQHALLVILNGAGEPQWFYTDICAGSGLEDGFPWTSDLYLDVIATCEVHNNGHWQVTVTEIIDADELEAALRECLVTPR